MPFEFHGSNIYDQQGSAVSSIRLASAEIPKLNFDRKDTPLLNLLRRLPRDSRAVAAAEKPDVYGFHWELKALILGGSLAVSVVVAALPFLSLP